MAHVIRFSTGLFDISKEDPNPVNPIAGQAVLQWIRTRLEGSGFTASEPATEDWGWYIDVVGNDATYLVGASGEPERPAPDMDWVVQIEKSRSFKERLTGRNKMTTGDPLVVLLERIVRNEPAFRDVEAEQEP